MPITLSILVYVASPLDFARYRHTALYFQFPAEETAPEPDLKSSLMEIVGSHGFFTFSERINWDIPVHSTELARIITLTLLPQKATIAEIPKLRATVASTPILANGERDWNCQNWVGDALARLVAAGYLDSAERNRGLDGMVDAVLEAKDEEIA
ncbi:hypothetical protein N7474_005451 [Penicillium riverlandense]|uniref:uncharacterized protein n=1 Tax=Penicillium riverlandense TaxID=1903569 RepID=UPI002549482B|nr:uncharacterized protein N7474_005451 [Penicillium riverlandense]KAJ5819860.1 hypothetical protein N7474_005451 [Penicillium riverlandense]